MSVSRTSCREREVTLRTSFGRFSPQFGSGFAREKFFFGFGALTTYTHKQRCRGAVATSEGKPMSHGCASSVFARRGRMGGAETAAGDAGYCCRELKYHKTSPKFHSTINHTATSLSVERPVHALHLLRRVGGASLLVHHRLLNLLELRHQILQLLSANQQRIIFSCSRSISNSAM